ncbi:lipopolysaccharide heptosyltransferase II [Bradyrhizobium sp. LHD-71]|uniref:lipopolysaccharide heptosyltransferase II n=1 Tax=Bradyrhizobium sp. LHD-71 TaxID=3072141 RepID=UPI00280D841B|nr:lipopolysaccharide heptosyltransferase II [Bradyrhizobium sp. LHD-71]MDQ8728433.1 lipopolysaccharide heptosyltransferase II [Bradyrhizobium sp. LHD-71]
MSEILREPNRTDISPILLIPYMWIGDFVRCHTVVRVLKGRWPDRPIDVLTDKTCAPLVDYMPGVRKGIVWDLPRRRLALGAQFALAAELRKESYGSALVMSRKWKAALAPTLAGIPERTGFIGEARFGLVNDWRRGEKDLPRMVDQCAALALPANARLPHEWPMPQLVVSRDDVAAWRFANKLGDRPAITLAPGAVGPSKRWSYFPEAARTLADIGFDVWVVGGPGEKQIAAEIVQAGGARVRDLTGNDLRNAILALAASPLAISNDSGLLHVAAAIGTPAVGIFGPTSPDLWKPLNPIAAVIQSRTDVPCRPCHKPVCRMQHHACMRDIPTSEVIEVAQRALAGAGLLATAARQAP